MNSSRISLRSPFLRVVAASMAVYAVLGSGIGHSQTIPIARILGRAETQRQTYIREFKNLTATESKNFQTFDRQGLLKKQRNIKSIFILLQLGDSEGGEEFRHVLEVDGKPVEGASLRAEKFFETTSNSEAKERKRIYDESLRYDLGILINGMTRNPSLVLERTLWPYFKYTLVGEETLSGTRVYKIAFEQTQTCPYIWVNRQPRTVAAAIAYNIGLPDFEPMNERLSGALYIDRETFQLVRENRKMTIFPEGFTAPVLVDENEFDYQPSPFGIRTPSSIRHTSYEIHFKQKRSSKLAVVTLLYSAFSKPEVEVRQVNNN